MSGIANLQQVISNISGVEKVQHIQQQQVQAEQARHVSESRKTAENKGKKVEDKDQTDKVEISVRDDRKGSGGDSEKQGEKEESKEESAGNSDHIDIMA